MDGKQQVLDAMNAAGQPVNASRLADMPGLDLTDVDRAMNDLKESGEIMSPRRCLWQPA